MKGVQSIGKHGNGGFQLWSVIGFIGVQILEGLKRLRNMSVKIK